MAILGASFAGLDLNQYKKSLNAFSKKQRITYQKALFFIAKLSEPVIDRVANNSAATIRFLVVFSIFEFYKFLIFF